MIKLFHRDILTQAVLIVVALLLLWGRALLSPAPMEAGEHPAVLYGLLCRWLAGVPRLAVVIAMLLVLLEGVMLNLLLANVGLVSQNSLLPTLLYLVAMSTGPLTLTPMILVCGIAIACLNQLVLRGTLLTISPAQICGATALIGVATLFYQPALFLMVSYLLIASNYRLYNWKDWMLMILGFAAPYVLLVAVLYMCDGLAAWWPTIPASLSVSHFPLATGHWSLATVATIFLILIFLWSLFNVISHTGERPVLWQRNASTVMLYTLGGVGMILATGHWLLATTTFLAIPFAFCTYRMLTTASETHLGFGRRKKFSWIYDLLLILTLIAALLC